mgnify:CR=1 FL=1
MPGRPPALLREPDEVDGPPVYGGQGLEEELVAGARLVLAMGGGWASMDTVLAAWG